MALDTEALNHQTPPPLSQLDSCPLQPLQDPPASPPTPPGSDGPQQALSDRHQPLHRVGSSPPHRLRGPHALERSPTQDLRPQSTNLLPYMPRWPSLSPPSGDASLAGTPLLPPAMPTTSWADPWAPLSGQSLFREPQLWPTNQALRPPLHPGAQTTEDSLSGNRTCKPSPPRWISHS